MSGGPLEGVRIVDLTSVVVGPLATQILADHGAEVIKVESPSGDLGRTIGGLGVTPGMGPKFLHLNRNKRSIVLDLKKPAGYEALMRLIERADVLVWNVRPGSMARMKLSYDDVRKVNPKIIYCGMFGFGQGGRYRKKPAYDSIIQGSTGVAALYHRAAGEPRYLPMVVADKTVGLIAVQMMLMALFHRERTGEGQSIEIPMFENMAAFVLSEHMYMKTFEPPRGTTGDPRLLDPQAKPLATKDGWIALSANTNAQAFAFFDAIGRPELKTDPRFDSVATRFNNVGEYFRIRAEALKEKTTAEWLDIFDACDVPAMPYHTLDSLMEDPHLKEVDFFRTVEHPTEGKIINMELPNKLSRGARSDFNPAPKIGQHSVEILREIGYADAQIEALVSGKITVDGRISKQA
ncbi:MAG TPA: CoA transferase [Burkholderiales bacterium]|nr:CoA transferase [Burkholderiales bacterium]